MLGKVKFFNESKGWGFILGDDQQDYFFHHTSILSKTWLPRTDDNIEFSPGMNEKGKIATKIREVE